MSETETRPESARLAAGSRGRWVSLEETTQRARSLCAVALPILEALAIHFEADRILARIVGTDALDEPAVPGLSVISDDDTVKRRFVGAVSGKTNGDHDVLLKP